MLMVLCSIDGNVTNISEMATNGTLCLCHPLSRHSSVSVYGAVQSQNGTLINNGDFVAFYSTDKMVISHILILISHIIKSYALMIHRLSMDSSEVAANQARTASA